MTGSSLFHCTVPYWTVLCLTVLYCAVLYCNLYYHTLYYCAVLCNNLLYFIVLYCTFLYCTVLHSRLLYCTGTSSQKWQSYHMGVPLLYSYCMCLHARVWVCVSLYCATVRLGGENQPSCSCLDTEGPSTHTVVPWWSGCITTQS